MAEPIDNLKAQIEFDFATKNDSAVNGTIDKLIGKVEEIEAKAIKIANSFDMVFSKLTTNLSKYSAQFNNITSQFDRFNQKLTQTSVQSQATMQKIQQVRTVESYGGNQFAEQERARQANEVKKLRREEWMRFGYERLSGAANRGLGIASGMAGQLEASNYTGIVSTGLRGIGAALPFGLGVIPSFFALKMDVTRSLAMQRATQEATMLNTQGLAGRANTGLLWSGVGYGYGNQAVASAAEGYLRSGGKRLSSGEMSRQMLMARSYGIDLNQVAQTTGEFERYSGKSGFNVMRNVMSMGQQGGVARPQMMEFVSATAQAFKQAISEGINIKNPRVIAESMSRFEKAGYRGAAAQAGMQSLYSSMQNAPNAADVESSMNLRAVMQYGGAGGSAVNYYEAAKLLQSRDPRAIEAMARYSRETFGTGEAAAEQKFYMGYTGGNTNEIRRQQSFLDTYGDGRGRRVDFRREDMAAVDSAHVRGGIYMAATSQNLRSQEATHRMTTDNIMTSAENMEVNARELILNIASGQGSKALMKLIDMMAGEQSEEIRSKFGNVRTTDDVRNVAERESRGQGFISTGTNYRALNQVMQDPELQGRTPQQAIKILEQRDKQRGFFSRNFGTQANQEGEALRVLKEISKGVNNRPNNIQQGITRTNRGR